MFFSLKAGGRDLEAWLLLAEPVVGNFLPPSKALVRCPNLNGTNLDIYAKNHVGILDDPITTYSSPTLSLIQRDLPSDSPHPWSFPATLQRLPQYPPTRSSVSSQTFQAPSSHYRHWGGYTPTLVWALNLRWESLSKSWS